MMARHDCQMNWNFNGDEENSKYCFLNTDTGKNGDLPCFTLNKLNEGVWNSKLDNTRTLPSQPPPLPQYVPPPLKTVVSDA